MPQTIACPHCSQALAVADDASGKPLRCPRCQKPFAVRFAAPAAAPARPGAPIQAPAPAGAARRCPMCKADVPPGVRACMDCGTLLPAGPAPATAPGNGLNSAPAAGQSYLPPPPPPPPPVAPPPPGIQAPPSPPAATGSPAHGPATTASPWVRLAPAALLGLALMGLLIRDFTVRETDQSEPEETTAPLEIDKDPRVVLVLQPEAFQFALTTKDNKKLTFIIKSVRDGKEQTKLTSFPAIRIDGKAYKPGLWWMVHGSGRKEGDIQRTDNVAIKYPGHKLGETEDLPGDGNGTHGGQRTGWVWDRFNVALTQTVEIIAGQADPATGKIPLDTCLVQFTLANKDSRPHKVGFRFLLDTYIGSNDGVPFYVPRKDRPLIDTVEDFPSPENPTIPDYIQALETGKLDNPGTVARVALKVGGGLEAPSRVSVTHHVRTYPTYVEAEKEVQVAYEIPMVSIKGNPGDKVEPDNQKPDSAVALYWQDLDLAPGAERTLGFAYGLGVLASGSGGTLAVTPPSNPRPGEDFPLVALVSDPVADQTVEVILLSKGLQLVATPAKQAAPPLPAGAASHNSSVTWRLKADKKGTYKVKVRTITAGKVQEVPVVITVRGNIYE
jgi:hypothetical protein